MTPALAQALSGAASWLDAPEEPAPLDPAGHLPWRLQLAVLSALGPTPRIIDAESAVVRRHRPDLARLLESTGGVLCAPWDAVLVDPIDEKLARLHTLRNSGVELPDDLVSSLEAELTDLRAAPPTRLQWDSVHHLPTHRAEWPGLRHLAYLARSCVYSVVPHWLTERPADPRLVDLARTLTPELLWGTCDAALRDELDSFPNDGTLAGRAASAAVLAFDRVTQNPERDEQRELEFFCADAWARGPAELAGGETTARGRSLAWFKWWTTEAVPACADDAA